MKKAVFVVLISFVIFFGLWEFVSRQYVEYRFILPPISAILSRMWGGGAEIFITNAQVTLREMAGGFALAAVVSFPLAWMMYIWKSSKMVLQPLFILIQSIPMFTLAPIMILWFGWSYAAIVIPTALMIFLPLTLNIYQGLASTPESLLEYFRINQATSWQTLIKLQLPWSMPYIFAGFRISAIFAGIGAIAGEWAGAQSGLGELMLKSRRAADLEVTFGALFYLIVISLGLYGMIAYAEYRYKQHKSLKLFSWFAVLCFLGMIGFISAPLSKDIATEERTTRLLLDWLPNSNHIPLYAGLQKNIFNKYNIHLQILELNDPSDTIPYVTSGKADLALFYLPDVLKANMRGSELAIAGILIDQPLNSFIFRRGEGIALPQDMSGKVIGYCVAGCNLDILHRLLKENHLNPRELRNVNFDLATLLGTRQVDVIYGAFWNIEGEFLKSLNIDTSYFEVSQLGHPHYSELVFISRSDFHDLDAFRQAMQESLDYCKEHPEEAFEIYQRCHKDKSSQTLAWERQAWLKTVPLLAKRQQISENELRLLKKWLKK